jgi:hypothetical protein
MNADEVFVSQGMVRGLQFGNSAPGGDFVHIRLARDPDYYIDFDEPEYWEDKKYNVVRVWWIDSLNERTGLTYRKVLDVEVLGGKDPIR